jgi:hypothetical protein
MKSILLSIALFGASAQLVIAQNVRIIRASDRTMVSSPVIIPAPAKPVKATDSSSVSTKDYSPNIYNPASGKASNVKCVRKSMCKKPCVKKVCSGNNNSSSSSPARKQVTTESVKK